MLISGRLYAAIQEHEVASQSTRRGRSRCVPLKSARSPCVAGKQLIGMRTDRDMTVRAVAAGCDPVPTLVRDVMPIEVVYGFDDEEKNDVARWMARPRFGGDLS